jgi:hypothetical protein
MAYFNGRRMDIPANPIARLILRQAVNSSTVHWCRRVDFSCKGYFEFCVDNSPGSSMQLMVCGCMGDFVLSQIIGALESLVTNLKRKRDQPVKPSNLPTSASQLKAQK